MDNNNYQLSLKTSEGYVRKNLVLSSGWLVGPVAAGATDFSNALVISLMFALITAPSVILCRFISTRLSYAVRVPIYAIVAALLYAPALLLTNKLLGASATDAVGVFLPVLVVNPLILSKTQTRFVHDPPLRMLRVLLGYIVGFAAVCILLGALRDALVNFSIGWLPLSPPFQVPALETAFGGFLLIGFLAATFRAGYAGLARLAKVRETAERKK
ncbi:MAG: hypothetical protein LBN40_02660 [Oscillospiraceae bacterium]|jgi:electron transport complex protein RnfE|nr:hypothetical protein [Oscillospiraceae bacterium]